MLPFDDSFLPSALRRQTFAHCETVKSDDKFDAADFSEMEICDFVHFYLPSRDSFSFIYIIYVRRSSFS